MAGAHVGRLNVYSTGLYGNEELLWRLFGDQNDTWNEAHVPVNVFHPEYQVNMVFSRRIEMEKNYPRASFKYCGRYVFLYESIITGTSLLWCR